MICGFIKWMVSQSLDSGNPLPSYIERHIERCGSCRDFVETSRMVETVLERDALRLQCRPFFADERVVRPTYSLQLATLTACVLIISGFLAVQSVQTERSSAAALSHIVPVEGITGLLSMSGIPADEIVSDAKERLNSEISYIAQDARSAAKYLAGSLFFGMSEIN